MWWNMPTNVKILFQSECFVYNGSHFNLIWKESTMANIFHTQYILCLQLALSDVCRNDQMQYQDRQDASKDEAHCLQISSMKSFSLSSACTAI